MIQIEVDQNTYNLIQYMGYWKGRDNNETINCVFMEYMIQNLPSGKIIRRSDIEKLINKSVKEYLK